MSASSGSQPPPDPFHSNSKKLSSNPSGDSNGDADAEEGRVTRSGTRAGRQLSQAGQNRERAFSQSGASQQRVGSEDEPADDPVQAADVTTRSLSHMNLQQGNTDLPPFSFGPREIPYAFYLSGTRVHRKPKDPKELPISAREKRIEQQETLQELQAELEKVAERYKGRFDTDQYLRIAAYAVPKNDPSLTRYLSKEDPCEVEVPLPLDDNPNKYLEEERLDSIEDQICDYLTKEKRDFEVLYQPLFNGKTTSETQPNPLDHLRHAPTTAWPIDRLFLNHYVLIVVNTPIEDEEGFAELWKGANYIIAADGGANKVFELVNRRRDLFGGDGVQQTPNKVVGDLDSIEAEVKTQYSHILIEKSDQNSTDLDKSLQLVKDLVESKELIARVIFIWAETTGRLDHNIGNLHSLAAKQFVLPRRPIFLVTSRDLSWFLPPGLHYINIPERSIEKDAHCGIIPLHGRIEPVRLENFEYSTTLLDFDTVISTSNKFKAYEGIDPNKKFHRAAARVWNPLDVGRTVLFTLEVKTWNLLPNGEQEDPEFGAVGHRKKHPLDFVTEPFKERWRYISRNSSREHPSNNTSFDQPDEDEV